MTQDAAPVAVVTALQVCVVVPLPKVNVTGWPLTGVLLSFVSTPETVNGCPFCPTVPPV